MIPAGPLIAFEVWGYTVSAFLMNMVLNLTILGLVSFVVLEMRRVYCMLREVRRRLAEIDAERRRCIGAAGEGVGSTATRAT